MRSSHFSLNFPVIESSNIGKARDKVDPHCEGYVWVPVLWSFDKFREVEVFSYLDIPCLKSHGNGFGCREAENGHGCRFKEMEPMLDEGDVHGQPTSCCGTVKNSPDCLLDQNGPCEIACMWLIDMRNMNDVWRIKLLLL